MKLIFTVLFSLFFYSALAQTIQYYDANGKKTSEKSLAKTYTETISNDSLIANIKTYNINGVLRSETNYSNLRKQILNGRSRYWFDNKSLKWERNYKDGKLDGNFKSYYKNGKLKRNDLYNEGKLIDGKCFGINGKDTTYYNFEIQPKFPGGEKAMIEFINANLKYPPTANRYNIQGLVRVAFIVNKQGKVVNPNIIQSVSPDLDNEAIRIVSIMPNWLPGEQDGEKVNVRFTLPVRFTIPEYNRLDN